MYIASQPPQFKSFGTICIGGICALGGNVTCNTIRHCIEQPSLNYRYEIDIGKNKCFRLKIYFPSGGDYSEHATYSYLSSQITILWTYDVRGGEYDENIQMQCFYHYHGTGYIHQSFNETFLWSGTPLWYNNLIYIYYVWLYENR